MSKGKMGMSHKRWFLIKIGLLRNILKPYHKSEKGTGDKNNSSNRYTKYPFRVALC